MEPVLIVIGCVVLIAGLAGLKYHKEVHEFMFGGSEFGNAPSGFLFLPLIVALGLGVLFIAYGLFA